MDARAPYAEMLVQRSRVLPSDNLAVANGQAADGRLASSMLAD